MGGCSVAGYFDLIAGTSTGGIIALGLAHGETAADILKFYAERGDKIFPPTDWLGRLFRKAIRLAMPIYRSGVLEEELLRIFQDAPFGSAGTRLCIPSFEGQHGEPWIFKTPHHPDYKKDQFERMVRVGLATSAAPTYLRALSNNGYVMIDGGLVANNPIMIGLVDALACFDIDRSQVQILSLGCGEAQFKVGRGMAGGGMWRWRDAIGGAMHAQSLNALGQAFLLVGKDNVVRIDAPARPDRIELDDFERAKSELPPMARSLVEAAGHRIKQLFLQSPAERYAPLSGV